MDDLQLLIEARRAGKSGLARALRKAAGLSQAEVAEVCGVSAVAVHRWERGQRSPHGEPAIGYGRLLRALQREVSAA